MGKDKVKISMDGSRRFLVVGYKILEIGDIYYFLENSTEVLADVVDTGYMGIYLIMSHKSPPDKLGKTWNAVRIARTGELPEYTTFEPGDKYRFERIEMSDLELGGLGEFDGW